MVNKKLLSHGFNTGANGHLEDYLEATGRLEAFDINEQDEIFLLTSMQQKEFFEFSLSLFVEAELPVESLNEEFFQAKNAHRKQWGDNPPEPVVQTIGFVKLTDNNTIMASTADGEVISSEDIEDVLGVNEQTLLNIMNRPKPKLH